MSGRRFFVCLFLYLLDCVVGSGLLCEEGFCRTFVNDVGCAEPAAHCRINNATHTGLWLPSPTICNCCEYCLPFYGKEQPCSLGGTGTGITIGRCTDGHTCVTHEDGNNYCQRMDTECHRAQDDYDRRYTAGQVGILEERPLCNGKGMYAHISCAPTQTCFCQTEEGERIFGEAPNLGTGMAERMQCGCSILHHKITSIINPGVPEPVVAPRCSADGNFHPIQCIANICHCVNVITGRILQGERRSVDLEKNPITKLICYNRELDNYPEQSEGSPPYKFTTPCYESIQEVSTWIQESIEDGYNMDYHNSLPQCLPDGSKGRTALLGNGTKICVDEREEQIDNYSAAPGTPEFEDMDCKCALTSHIMTSNELPVCCKNGNFRSVQCRRGVCWCVDSDGRQVGSEAENIMLLGCFNVNWRHC
ncbi:uncharacterized protein LOC128681368 [Plodia interpunctella]|uniref:uncharacterized protein LOC128681368 n=1 Tax=Plodia interpunctella TaxID=58824 RepID=UPI00236863B1|nr:uncharacterized protein LOC128681368 [Plodia interpunctella]